MIVKVQLSLVTNAGARQVLVYDQGRTIRYEGTASAELIGAMRGQGKAFFNAEVGSDQYLDIDFYRHLPDQGW